MALVAGGTGYVGGRLIRVLREHGYPVRCLARRPKFLEERVGRHVDVVKGDVLQKETLAPALHGVDTAFYLVHSMGDDRSFEELERAGAENFGAVAKETGVRRIIYLGGLGGGPDLSPH
ncbi:MAG: NAD(P)H-binding protein, partial [Ignavibacteria bacterium]|nr:NAD(P)H-binding protein [Ignavibacteria bacterium]